MQSGSKFPSRPHEHVAHGYGKGDMLGSDWPGWELFNAADADIRTARRGDAGDDLEAFVPMNDLFPSTGPRPPSRHSNGGAENNEPQSVERWVKSVAPSILGDPDEMFGMETLGEQLPAYPSGVRLQNTQSTASVIAPPQDQLFSRTTVRVSNDASEDDERVVDFLEDREKDAAGDSSPKAAILTATTIGAQANKPTKRSLEGIIKQVEKKNLEPAAEIVQSALSFDPAPPQRLYVSRSEVVKGAAGWRQKHKASWKGHEEKQ